MTEKRGDWVIGQLSISRIITMFRQLNRNIMKFGEMNKHYQGGDIYNESR